MKRVAVSIGDLNGVGFEIAIKSHNTIKKNAKIYYCISKEMALQAASKLGVKLPDDFDCVMDEQYFAINAGQVCANAGKHSFDSFKCAVDLVEAKRADAVVTLPINKEAWSVASIQYKGHTEYLKSRYGEAIMMLGCDKLFVALYSDHIPLCEVYSKIAVNPLTDFLVRLAKSVPFKRMAVLGLNPHSGDNGVIGSEESAIKQAIDRANSVLERNMFFGPVVPDSAFTKASLAQCNRVVALYHDQGLIPLKALYFDKSINVSVGIPIVRTSVDHGTAFDRAYKGADLSNKSYLNAVKYALDLIEE